MHLWYFMSAFENCTGCNKDLVAPVERDRESRDTILFESWRFTKSNYSDRQKVTHSHD